MSEEKPNMRRVNLKLPPEVHHRLRILAAQRDETLQQLIARLAEEAVKDVVLPAPKSK